MKRLSLILNYVAQFILLFSLFFDAGKVLQIIKMCLVVVVSYLLYRISYRSTIKDDLKEYNFLYVATSFVFILYFAGYSLHWQYHILLGMVIAAYLGLFSSYLYKEKFLSRPKKPIKIVNFTVEEKDKQEDLNKIIQEAKALVAAEKVAKKETKKKPVKKVTKKTTKKSPVKKKAVKKTKKKTSTKKATKKKAVKKNSKSTGAKKSKTSRKKKN